MRMAYAFPAHPAPAGCSHAAATGADTGAATGGGGQTPAERFAMAPRTGSAPTALPPCVRRPVRTPGTDAPFYAARWQPIIRVRQAHLARVAPQVGPETRASGIALPCAAGPTMANARAMQQRNGRPITRIAECGEDGACIAAFQDVHTEVMTGSPDRGALIAGSEYSPREGMEN